MGNKQGVARKGKAGAATAAGGAGGGEEEKEGGIDYDLQTSRGGQVTIDDFDLLKVLGKGSFGKVMLVKKKSNQQLYAMKTLRKAALIKRKQLVHTSTERQILQHMEHPFLTALEFAFQTQEKLYLVMPYMGGGELFFWLKKHRRFSLARAKLYTAEMVMALGALHEYNIVYRDMKPENLLMTHTGQAKLCDLGIAKVVVGRTYTMCGTPDYMAPEVVSQKGHGLAVDWWTLGVLIYELITGTTPFESESQWATYKMINQGFDKITWPAEITESGSKSLIQDLCHLQPSRRLPMKENGVANLKKKRLWAGIDWDLLPTDQFQVPWKPSDIDPKTACKGRVSQEDVEAIQTPYEDDGSGWDKDF